MDDLDPSTTESEYTQMPRRSHPLAILAELALIPLIVSLRLTTPTLLLLLVAWVSVRVRNLSWFDLGLKAPRNWVKTVIAGILAGSLYAWVSTAWLIPLLRQLTHTEVDNSAFELLRGNPVNLVGFIFLAWTLGALAEELVFRTYVLNRLADLFGQRSGGWITAGILSAGFYGFTRLYQGAPGIAESLVFGLLLSALYLLDGRRMWLPVIAHGVSTSTVFVLIYLGMYP